MKERIAFYLAEGLKPADVASIVGCSAGYISQLLKDESFKSFVEDKVKNKTSTADETLVAKYQGLEHRIVNEMSSSVIGAELPHLTKALEAIVKAQEAAHKRANPHLATSSSTTLLQQIVQISVPQHAVPVLQLNNNSEVIAIDNKPLAPMTSDGVKKLFSTIAEKRNVAQIPNTTSSSSTEEPARIANAAT